MMTKKMFLKELFLQKFSLTDVITYDLCLCLTEKSRAFEFETELPKINKYSIFGWIIP